MRRLLLAALVVGACSESKAPAPWAPAVADVAGLALERIYAGPQGLRGFDGAASPGAALVLARNGGDPLAEDTADGDGRFRLPADLVPAERVVLRVDGQEHVFEVRDPPLAREQAVGDVIAGAGATPNDLVIVGTADAARAAVVRSGDNAVGLFDLQSGFAGAPTGVRLPEQAGDAANPWFIEPFEGTNRFVVSAFGQRGAYLVNLEVGTVDAELFVAAEVQLPEPFTLSRPFDVNGDGQPQTIVQRFVPQSAQALAVTEDAVFVGFVNLFAPTISDDRAVFLPGVLARFDRTDLGAPATLIPLPFTNPQFILRDGQRLIVVCSGSVDFDDGAPSISSDGGLVEVDLATGEVQRVVELGRFGAAHAVFSSGWIWVSSLIKGQVQGFEFGAGAEPMVFELNDEVVDSVFRLVALPEGLVLAGSFDGDNLHVIDSRTRQLAPEPFDVPLQVGPGLPVLDGLHTVARRPGRRGVDFVGPDVFVLSSIAATVRGIELRQLLGP